MRAMRFVFSNRLHVVAMGPGIVAFWNQFLGLPLGWQPYAVIFGVVSFGYILNIFFDHHEDSHNDEVAAERVIGQDTRTRWLALFTFVGTGALAFQHNAAYGVLVLVALVGAGAYSAPLRWRGRHWRIKALPYVKNTYSAAHWSLMLLALAYAHVWLPFSVFTWVACAICFFMNLFVEVLWDVRDAEGDRQTGVRTLSTEWGTPAARVLLHAINLAILAVVIPAVLVGMLPTAFWLVAAHTLTVAIFIEVFMRLRSKRLASHLYLIYVMVALVAILLVNSWLSSR